MAVMTAPKPLHPARGRRPRCKQPRCISEVLAVMGIALLLAACGPSFSSSSSTRTGVSTTASPAPAPAPTTASLASRWVKSLPTPTAVVKVADTLLMSTATGLTALTSSGDVVWHVDVRDDGGSQGTLIPFVIGSTAYALVDAGHNQVRVGPVNVLADTTVVVEINVVTGAVISHSSIAWGSNNHDGHVAPGLPVAASKSTVVFSSAYHQLPVFYDLAQRTVTTVTQREPAGCGDASFAPLSPFQVRGRQSVSLDRLPDGQPRGWLVCQKSPTPQAYLVDHRLDFGRSKALPAAQVNLICSDATCLSISTGADRHAQLLSSADLTSIGNSIQLGDNLTGVTTVGSDDWILTTRASTTAVNASGARAWTVPEGRDVTPTLGTEHQDVGVAYPVVASSANGSTVDWLDTSSGKKVKSARVASKGAAVLFGGDVVGILKPDAVEVLTASRVLAMGPGLADSAFKGTPVGWRVSDTAYLVASTGSQSVPVTLLQATGSVGGLAG